METDNSEHIPDDTEAQAEDLTFPCDERGVVGCTDAQWVIEHLLGEFGWHDSEGLPVPLSSVRDFAACNRFIVAYGTRAQCSSWFGFLAEEMQLYGSQAHWIDKQNAAMAAERRGESPQRVSDLRYKAEQAKRVHLAEQRGEVPDESSDEDEADICDEDTRNPLAGFGNRATAYHQRWGKPPTHILVPYQWEPCVRREIAKMIAGTALDIDGLTRVADDVKVNELGNIRIVTPVGEVQLVWADNIPYGLPECFRFMPNKCKGDKIA